MHIWPQSLIIAPQNTLSYIVFAQTMIGDVAFLKFGLENEPETSVQLIVAELKSVPLILDQRKRDQTLERMTKYMKFGHVLQCTTAASNEQIICK